MSSSTLKPIYFGPYEVTEQVFYTTPRCYCLVNIKPILPGHVLVVPYRAAQRLTDLSHDEITDLFTTVQKVQKMLAKRHFGANGDGKIEGGSFNIAIQDGPESGQTVPHVHCHVIPRTKQDPVEGDGIYDKLQGEEGNVGGGFWDQRRPTQQGKFPDIEDVDRKPRAPQEMNKEASLFKEQMDLIDRHDNGGTVSMDCTADVPPS